MSSAVDASSAAASAAEAGSGTVRVALALPLYQCFDYRLPPGRCAAIGSRVRVPFGTRERVGIVVARGADAATPATLKPVLEVLDAEPVLPPELFELCAWVADYYQQPLGEVFAAALPAALRRGRPQKRPRQVALRLTAAGQQALPQLTRRASAQRALLLALAESGAVPRLHWLRLHPKMAVPLRHALRRGWVEQLELNLEQGARPQRLPGPPLQAQQQAVLDRWLARDAGFSVSLLQGVTGSGKTEVYLHAAAAVLERGGRVLVLVPEIGLTPQLYARFAERFGLGVAAYHSGLSEAERAAVWAGAAAGEVSVLVGTRSAVFVPLPALGLVVVDEEHDSSFKQQEGLIYSARETATIRARRAGAAVILGSATPSLETLHNAADGRYAHLRLAARANASAAPRIQPIDLRGRGLRHGLSQPLIDAIARHLEAGGQALLFVNRRGYAPSLLCHECGWVASCAHCDARLTLHREPRALICHHCGARQRLPERCGRCDSRQLMPVGQGTERVEDILRGLFPEVRIERFDSDRLRNAREVAELLEETHAGRVRILVGTQMLTKGHDFAGLSLVGVVNADQALYSGDFRALERLGQLLTQVAGRAGRAQRPGEVLLQTHEPDHPMLRTLLERGYEAFADGLLAERRRMRLPPYAHLALLRSDADRADDAMALLNAARAQLPAAADVEVLGPVPAPMEKRAGRSRAQLLLCAGRRSALHRLLRGWIPGLTALPEARRARWSIDVDPVDLF